MDVCVPDRPRVPREDIQDKDGDKWETIYWNILENNGANNYPTHTLPSPTTTTTTHADTHWLTQHIGWLFVAWAPFQYIDRLIYVWRFPC